MRHLPFNPSFRCVLATIALCGGTAYGNDQTVQLANGINALRQEASECDGVRLPPASVLAPVPRLGARRVESASDLEAMLRDQGYQAASVQLVGLSGIRDTGSVIDQLSTAYCKVIRDPQFSEIGVWRQGAVWQVVLARPLLDANMKDWKGAGRDVLEAVNRIRRIGAQCGDQRFDPAPALAWSDSLGQAALMHSEDMAQHNVFSHTGTDGSMAGERADRAGYTWQFVGENVAAGQGSVDQVVAGWLASREHCFNIMNPDFTEMGAAYSVNSRSTAGIYWTQVFGTPR